MSPPNRLPITLFLFGLGLFLVGREPNANTLAGLTRSLCLRLVPATDRAGADRIAGVCTDIAAKIGADQLSSRVETDQQLLDVVQRDLGDRFPAWERFFRELSAALHQRLGDSPTREALQQAYLDIQTGLESVQ